MNIIKYPDNTSYVNNTELRDIIFKINTYEDLWHLNQYVDAYNDQWNEKPTITIPCLLEAQADRRFKRDESFGLKLVLKQLVQMNTKFKIFHPHNQEVVEMAFEMYDKKVEIIDNSEFIKKVLDNLALEEFRKTDRDMSIGFFRESNLSKQKDNLILMSSDAGGFKPLMKLCNKIQWQGQTASASKSRLWDGKESRLIQQIQCDDFEGKNILLIDDICVYGGTFKGLSKMLKERNCGKLYLAVSHITVQNLGEDPVTNYFDTVFCTNSKFDKYWFTNTGGHEESIDNLKIVKLF